MQRKTPTREEHPMTTTATPYPLDTARSRGFIVNGCLVPVEVAGDRDRAAAVHPCTCGHEWWFGGYDCIVCHGYPTA